MCLASSCFTGSRAMLIAHVVFDKTGVGVVVETPKSSFNYSNQVTSTVNRAIACNFVSLSSK
jgi:hypothetical protein